MIRRQEIRVFFVERVYNKNQMEMWLEGAPIHRNSRKLLKKSLSNKACILEFDDRKKKWQGVSMQKLVWGPIRIAKESGVYWPDIERLILDVLRMSYPNKVLIVERGTFT